MRTLTLGQARPTIARVIGCCPDSSKVPEYLNEADERLLNRPSYPVKSLVRFRVCPAAKNCITFPREVRTIEAYWICSTPGVIRSQWWENIGYPNGTGLLGDKSFCGTTLVDQGTACAFDEVVSSSTSPRKIAVVAMNAADAGKKITLRYLDSTGNRVYTSIGGVVQEGQQLTLVTPIGMPGAVYTSSNVLSGGLYHVVKEVTKYPVILYEVDGNTLAITNKLAEYEPSEEVPIYRRAYVPGLKDIDSCVSCCDDSDCTNERKLTALVKLQHVPVVVDNDPLVIGNLAALKLMVMVILREEGNRHDEAALLEGKANLEIEGEISSYLGDGMVGTIKAQADFGAGEPAALAAWGAY